jgi:hypothetical protein
MIKRFALGLVALLSLTLAGLPLQPAGAQGISQKVAVCDPNYNASCAAVGPRASVNGSTTVTLGGTFQTVLAASATRRNCLIQNPTTATEVLFVHVGTLASATTAKAITLAAGSAFSCAGSGGNVEGAAINVTAATNGHAFVLLSQ